MVSTRGHKYKFTDGERVLCYEPDPTKAKVLYDSKVLEVKIQKEERGRKTVEYLIHFQGWNSSWDRCVSEDHVLKDTEENRKLQRDLAEKSQLQLGAYLYRRERKKRPHELEVEEGPRSCSSEQSQDDGDANKTEEETEEGDDTEEVEVAGGEEEELLTTTDDDKESSVDTDDSLDEKVPLDLSVRLKAQLEHDHELVNKQNKIVRLPATPNVLEILEGYVRHAGQNQLQSATRQEHRRHRHKHSHTHDNEKDMEVLTAHLNLTREVADGLRIYFDFTLGPLLLYNAERVQWEESRAGKEYQREGESCETDDSQPLQSLQCQVKQETPDQMDTERKRSLRSHRDSGPTEPQQVAASPVQDGSSRLTLRNLGSLGHNNHCSARSSSSSSSCTGTAPNPAPRPLPQLAALLEGFRIVPAEYLEHRPSHPAALYGAPHLARLFVKLPTLLYAANQPEKENQPRILPERKLKVLLQHLQLFLQYLDSKPEWFGERHYVENCSTSIKME